MRKFWRLVLRISGAIHSLADRKTRPYNQESLFTQGWIAGRDALRREKVNG